MISDSLLQGVYRFADLNADERASLAKIAEEMALPAGFPIFSTGDPATALYLIKDGSVRVAVTSSGGRPLIDGAMRSAPAVTLEPTSMFRFDYDKVTALLDRSPATAAKLYRSLARFLSNRLRQTTTDMSYAREKNLRHF